MKTKRLVLLIVSLLLLATSLSFSSCSQKRPTKTDEIINLVSSLGPYETVATDPAMEYRYKTAFTGNIIEFKDAKSAKLYREILECHYTEQKNYEYNIAYEKYLKKYSPNAETWIMHDQQADIYREYQKSAKDSGQKVEISGSVLYFGYQLFFDALNGEDIFNSSNESEESIGDQIEGLIKDTKYKVVAVYYEIFAFLVPSEDLYNVIRIGFPDRAEHDKYDVTICQCYNSEHAKIYRDGVISTRKYMKKTYKAEIDYYEHILSTYEQDMDEQEFESITATIEQKKQSLENLNWTNVVIRYGNKVIIGDIHGAIMVWLSYLPIIGSWFA